MNKATGGCLCGGVKYEVNGPLRPVVYCHCGQCRRTSGHFVAATACKYEDLTVLVDNGLRWFESSDNAGRGFCAICGSSVFWHAKHEKNISIMAGTLDGRTGLKAAEHIFVTSAGDYYSFNDGLPRHDAGRS